MTPFVKTVVYGQTLINRYESEANPAKRAAFLNDVRDYHYNEKITIPLVLAMPVWAWRNKTVGDWPENPIDKNANFEYARHAKPVNTWRLYTP